MTPQNIESLRQTLLEITSGLRAGTVAPATAEAITNAAGKIIGTIRCQLEYARATSTVPKIKFMEDEA